MKKPLKKIAKNVISSWASVHIFLFELRKSLFSWFSGITQGRALAPTLGENISHNNVDVTLVEGSHARLIGLISDL